MATKKYEDWVSMADSLVANQQKAVQTKAKTKKSNPKTTGSTRSWDAPTVGEDLFLNNVLPIKQDDSLLKKTGKGAVNAFVSTVNSPGELLRRTSITAGNVLSGQGNKLIPKNTSFVEDIMPAPLSKSVTDYSVKHPFLGGLAQMGIETVADPTTFLTAGTGKALLNAEKTGVKQAGKAPRAIVSEELPSFDSFHEPAVETPKQEYAPWVNEGLIQQANKDRAQAIKQSLTQERNPFEDMGGIEYTQPWPDYIPPKVDSNFTADAFGNVQRGLPLQALPGAPQRLALPGSTPLQLTTHQMQALPARGRIPKQKIKDSTKAGELWYVDPEGAAGSNTDYLASVSKQYNDLIKAETDNIKGGVNGVLKYGDMNNGYRRASLNPSWYRDFYDKFGRAPTEGEYRNMAIENLTRGNAETGAPANDEFLSILSELSRGQKLPDEWHNLTRGMREMESMGEPELAPLIDEMGQHRSSVEPHGINRDWNRLNNVEAGYRQRMSVPDANYGQYDDVNLKRSSARQEKDFKFFQQAFSDPSWMDTGEFTIQKAPEAFDNPEFAAANALVKANTGRDVIPFKGSNSIAGAQADNSIFLNKDTRQPVSYIALHEVGHDIKVNNPEAHQRMLRIVQEHIADNLGLTNHYSKMGYSPEKHNEELLSDAFAEVGHDPSFWARVRNEAPELLKPILDTIDRVIANVKAKVGDDMSILPYLKDVEQMRNRLADEYRDYLSEQRGAVPEQGQMAAKIQGDINLKLSPENRAEQYRNMVLAAARQGAKSGGYTPHFREQMLKQFPELADEAQADNILKYVYDRGQELRKGQTILKGAGQEITLSKADMQADNQIKAGQSLQDWNHVTSKTDRALPGIKQGAKNAANATYRGMVDDLYRLDQLDTMQKVKTGKGFNADERAYILALNARESGGTAKQILTDGLYDPQGNKIGESLASVTKQIPKGREQDFSNYLVYRHAPSWLEQGRQVFPEGEGITADIARQRAAAYEQAHPEFKQIANSLNQWQRDFGKAWLVDTGIIKPETWEAFQQMYPDYIPLQRKFSDIEKGGPGVRRGYANQSNPVKKAQGSQRQIIDPIESIIEQVDKYVKVARRNEVMQTIIKNVEKDPETVKDWLEIVPGETTAAKSVDDALMEDGLEGIIDSLDQPFQAAHEGKRLRLDRPNIVAGIVDGEKVHLKVSDQSLLDALANLTPQGANSIVEGVRQVTRTMKVLTTGANVFFASRNIVRDLPMSYINSRTTNNPFRWAWDIVDSMARVATGGKHDPGNFYQTYKSLGGGSHSSSIAADRNLLAESKAAVMPGYYSLDKPLTSAGRGAKAVGRGIESFTNAVETIPRLPEYIRTAKAGGDTYGARQAGLHAAQDVTVNFSRHGSKAKDADAFIPYLNASLQGMDKLARSYGSNPVATVAKSIAALSVPTIGLYLLNRDDKDYKQLSSFVKDNNYCIPMGNGKFLKIAKPREAGVVFSSLVERCLNQWANDDPEGFKGFAEAWKNNFIPPIRTIAAPFNDVRSNKNFADVPIVPGYMENLSPKLQYDENTSAPAKAIGNAFNVSPKKLDYLARSYTGFLGEFGIPAASEGRGQGIGQRMGDVLKKTYVADPLYSNDVISRFYEEKDKIDQSRSDAGYLGKEKPDSEKSSMYNRAAKDIGGINKQIRAINKDKSLSYAQKQTQTRELRKQMLDIAKQAMSGKYAKDGTGGLSDWMAMADSLL